MALQQIVEQTVTGLGYDLVEIERAAGGLLRITIDLPWHAPQAGQPPQPEAFITVEDCEKVTRQLQFALEVEGVDYQRLEVSSPGIDRLLRHEQDFLRFSGELVDITLKEPIGAAAQGQVAPNRKKFRGTLEPQETGQGWQIVWSDAPPPKPGQRVSKKRAPAPLQALGFTLDELREARLADVVNFKGRGHQSPLQPLEHDTNANAGANTGDNTTDVAPASTD
ncbi:MAG: ribosome maturation factor RimP [Comamonas sp.]|nr:ribosome maturation factor RimP [Comamonas sp.]